MPIISDCQFSAPRLTMDCLKLEAFDNALFSVAIVIADNSPEEPDSELLRVWRPALRRTSGI